MIWASSGFDRVMRAVAPTGNSRYASLFLASRVLAAVSSATFAICSFAVAGAANVGAFAAVASACAFSGGIAGGWLSQSLLRFHQMSNSSVLRLLYWSSWRGWAFTVIALLAGSVVAAYAPSSIRAGWQVSLLLAILLSAVLAVRYVQLGRAMVQHSGVQVIVLELGQGVSLTIPPLLAVSLRSSVPYIWRCLLLAILVNVLAMVLARIKSPGVGLAEGELAQDWPTPGQLFRYGAPLGVWIGLSSIYQNADRVMLAWFASEKVAGEYSLLYDISSRGLMLPITAMSGAASAAVLRLFNGGETRRATLANRQLVRVQAAIILALLVPVALGAALAMRLLPWFELEHAVSMVLAYLAAGVWACGDTLQRERMGTGSTIPLVKWLAIFALGGLVVDCAAIPLFGMVGAAAVTLLSAVGYTTMIARDVGVLTRTRFGVRLSLTSPDS